MKQSEHQLMWQSRIQAFHTSGEASVATSCAKKYTCSKYILMASQITYTNKNPASSVVVQEPVLPEAIPITL